MTEENTQVADEQGAENGQADKKAKELQRCFETIARQEIRRARRLVTDGQPTPEATFAVSIANVLAVLDLAAAIREHGGKA